LVIEVSIDGLAIDGFGDYGLEIWHWRVNGLWARIADFAGQSPGSG
jgi:hypothetical protein